MGLAGPENSWLEYPLEKRTGMDGNNINSLLATVTDIVIAAQEERKENKAVQRHVRLHH